MSAAGTVVLIGFTLGCFAALRAVGFAVAYDALGESNLAYGDSVVLAGLFAAGVHERTGSVVLTVTAGIGLSIVLALATDFLVLRPLRGRGDPLSPIMATIGLALVVRNLSEQTQGVEDKGFPALFGSASASVVGTSVDVPVAVAAFLILVLGVGGALLLRRSGWGRVVRAVRSDGVGARLTGIPVTRVVTILYAVGGAVGGLAGLVVFAHVGNLSVSDGFRFTLIAFAAAAFGGGRSISWAVVGGLALGMVAAVVQYAYGEVWTEAAYLVILIAVLLVRPYGFARGLSGQRV